MKYNIKINNIRKLIKRITIIINCFLILLIFSDCEKRKTAGPVPIVDIEGRIKYMDKICINQFADHVYYVPLECNLDHQIFYSTRILSAFSGKYILDSDGRICLLYDNEGHYLRQIGKPGRGPGEYTGISSVFLIHENIYIRDYFGDLNQYSLDGTFVKRHKSGYTSNKKYRLDNGIMINDSMILGNIENRTGQEEFKALIINRQGDVRYYFKNYIFFRLGSGVSHAKSPGEVTMYSFGNENYFKEFLNDTLFRIDDKYRFIPDYVFNLGKYKQPLSTRGMSWEQIDLSSYIDLYGIFQTKNLLILNCGFNKYFSAKRLTPEIISLPGLRDYTQWYNTKTVLGIYEKRTRKLVFSEPTSTDIHLNTSGFYNDFDAGPRFIPDKMVNDSIMVMKIRFDLMIEYIKSDDFKKCIPKYPKKKERLEVLVDSLEKSGFNNPILMFVTFKQ